MRLSGFILAIMILTLSLLPCADNEISLREKNRIELSTLPSNHDNDHKDACSPLCHCYCCSLFSIDLTLGYNNFLSFDSNNISSFLSEDLISISLPIWQPPKI